MIKEKFKEVITTVLPITILVLILNFTIVPIEKVNLIRFLLGAVCIVVGLSVFLLGVDINITPIGESMGNLIVRSGKLSVVVIASLLLGFVISIAEPDLHLLSGQVDLVTSGMLDKNLLVLVVSIGVAILVAVGK